MTTIVFNGFKQEFNDVHIAKKGDKKSWSLAWFIADEYGCLAPSVIELVAINESTQDVLLVDREDKHKAECVAIICSKEKSEFFPNLTDHPHCMGYQFVYNTDTLEVK